MPARANIEAKFVQGASKWTNLPAGSLPEVAFAGRSNVGKSSLLNMLVGRRALARTSNTPGKTQELNYYLVGDRLHIVDLPGFGYAKTAQTERYRWARLIEQYVAERAQLRVVFHLVDGRHDPTALDRAFMDLMRETSPASYVLVLTKADKLSGNERAARLAATRRLLEAQHLEVPVVLTSAHDKRGRDELWGWIDSLTG